MPFRKHIKRFALPIALAASLAGMPPAVLAQSAPSGDRDINRGELQNFDNFLDKHPEIREQLKQNPNLVNDPTYLSQHPQLQKFLRAHKEASEELKENPQAFMTREKRFDRTEDSRKGDKDINRRELKSFDGFLDGHPEIREQLAKNPGLADDPAYLAKHPELKEFLSNHPGVREEMKENPKAFMKRERRFERNHRNERAENRRPRRIRDRD